MPFAPSSFLLLLVRHLLLEGMHLFSLSEGGEDKPCVCRTTLCVAIKCASACFVRISRCTGEWVQVALEASTSFRNAESDRFGTQVKWSLGSGFWETFFGEW